MSCCKGPAFFSVCPHSVRAKLPDANSSGTVTIAETVTAANNATNGCPSPPPVGTPTPTASPCATNGASQPGSIVVFENLQVNGASDPVLSLANPSRALANAYCFYADSNQPACTTFGFNVQLSAGSSLQWQAGVGGPVPGTGIPFSGELVCVQVDQVGGPFAGNSLVGTLQNGGQCPIAATSISGFPEANDQDNVLCLGDSGDFNSCPTGAEYGDCPAGVDPARIEGCWSQSQFKFVCTTASATPTPTPTTTPATPPPPTRTVAPLADTGPVSAYVPASLLVYPYLTVDSARGVDTVVQMTNVSGNAVMVRCFYEDTTGRCANQPATACIGAAGCAAGAACAPGWSTSDFTITLTRRQPTAWRVSQGLGTAPPGTRSIPPVPEDPFAGLLRCFVVDSTGTPIGNNALNGEATVERFVAGTQLDVARYNAVGLSALTTGNGDNVLVVGGIVEGEYASCPDTAILNHFFDGAPDPVLPGRTVATTLALVPCSVDYLAKQPSTVTVKYQIFNEFEQRFTASDTVAAQKSSPLGDVAPVFDYGMVGTLTGQARIAGVEGGVLGVALETHQDGAASQSAGLNLFAQGLRTSTDTVIFPVVP
jgi:hypothetical protein